MTSPIPQAVDELRPRERLPVAFATTFLLIVAATYVVNAMDRTVFATLLPGITAEFGLSLAAGGFIATIFTLGLSIADWQGGDARIGANAEHHLPVGLINRNTILVSIASIAGGIAGYGYLGLYPTFLRTQLGFSVQATGSAAAMYGVGALTGLWGVISPTGSARCG